MKDKTVTIDKKLYEKLINANKERDSVMDELSTFKRFVELSGAGVGWADMNGKIKFANERLCNIFKENTIEDMLGKNVLNYYGEEGQHKLLSEIFPHVRHKGYWHGELIVILKDGTEA